MATTYVDSNFVLNAGSPTFNVKPVPLTNSQMTLSSKDLSFNSLRGYSPERYGAAGSRTISDEEARELRSSSSPTEYRRSLRSLADNTLSRSGFERNNNRLCRTASRSPSPSRSIMRDYSPVGHDSCLRKSVSFNRDYTGYSSEVDKLTAKDQSEADFKERMYRLDSSLATWATHPVHLKETTDPATLRNSLRRSPSPTRQRRARSRSPSPYRASLRSSRNASPENRFYEEYPVVGNESLAKEFFPNTMKAYKINHMEPPMSRSMMSSPPPKHLRAKPEHKWRADGRIANDDATMQELEMLAKREDEIDKMYNMVDAAPSIAAGTVHMVSPYASELASLRLSRLKIEEEHLLEMKRLAELERIRGPQPKWYELKTPQFHYEHHKNTELLANKDQWQGLIDYRKSLKTASKAYQSKNYA